MTPKVSIVVPCYKVEKYLDRCVKSLTSQSLQDIEIILVDDGSPDKVPQMCDKWRELDSRIKVIHKKNAGLGFARNSGLELARGEFVTFVDSDDYVELNTYEILYNTAKEKKADIVYFGLKKEYKQGHYTNHKNVESIIEYNGEEIDKIIPDFIASAPYQKSEYKYEMSVCTTFLRKQIIDDNNLKFVSERDYASEDLIFQLDLLTQSKKIVFIPNIFYNYCWNGNSLTRTVSQEKHEKIKALYFIVSQKSKKYDPETLRAKRLFIGYIRSFIRTLVETNLSFHEKKQLIKKILHDEIWDSIKSYKPVYLPIHQRLFLYLFYEKSIYLTFFFAKFINRIK